MSFADAFAQIALAVSAQVGGPFHDAKVITTTLTQDDGGNTTADTPVERTCTVQIDESAEAMRKEGFTDGDALFIVFASTLSGSLDTDAEIQVMAGPHVGLWKVSSLRRDPVGIGWVGKGVRG